MRNHVHDTPVRFRANEHLLAAARLKAEQRGMSVSELLRAALRKEIDA
jgi:predicted DNA binding CopG/RHH family protein